MSTNLGYQLAHAEIDRVESELNQLRAELAAARRERDEALEANRQIANASLEVLELTDRCHLLENQRDDSRRTVERLRNALEVIKAWEGESTRSGKYAISALNATTPSAGTVVPTSCCSSCGGGSQPFRYDDRGAVTCNQCWETWVGDKSHFKLKDEANLTVVPLAEAEALARSLDSVLQVQPINVVRDKAEETLIAYRQKHPPAEAKEKK